MVLQATDIINIGLLLIAILSLLVSLIPILRDKPKLDFSLYVAEIVSFPGGRTVKEGSYYLFKIVNAGIRPVTISSIGGISKTIWWKWLIFTLTRKVCVPRHFVIFSPELQKITKDENGNSRTLFEGSVAEGHLPISNQDLLREGGLKATRFYVSDSVGRKYYLPRRAHRKLKKDIQELIQGATNSQ